MGMSRFEIDIDEIVVSGVPVTDVDAFGDALRARLAELAAGGLPGAWRGAETVELSVPHATAAPVPAGSGDAAFGAGVAESVWRGLAPPLLPEPGGDLR